MNERLRRQRAGRTLLAVIGIIAVLLSTVQSAETAQAAGPADGFQAGNIVSDVNFYDGDSLTAAEVQTFLDEQVTRCTIGDAGRAPGSAWGNTTIAKSCLNNLRVTSPTRAADQFCSTYVGGVNESAAAIIAKVGKACGISQKVLLVMLQKEQALVTDTWPTTMQLDWAMGYACPDTAACDTQYRGIFNQVYKAAWQLKVYKAYSASYRYQPGRSNSIQWHPNAGCGTSQVFIENFATAGLYIYTPYRPNQAALNAGWGTGDSCSSYGNRNFYGYFRAWFGSPTAVPTIHPNLASRYMSLGGPSGTLGHPLKEPEYIEGRIKQQFEGGDLYWSAQYGAFSVANGMLTRFNAEGGLTGTLQSPMSMEQKPVPGTARQEFAKGSLYWVSGRGTFRLNGAIRSLYQSEGDLNGTLGVPISEEYKPVSGSAVQEFSQGTIFWSRAGTYPVRGGMLDVYAGSGGPGGELGNPTSHERKDRQGTATQEFQNANLYWTSGVGFNAVRGDFRAQYRKLGEVNSLLGAPIRAEDKPRPGTARQQFEHGNLYWTSGVGSWPVTGDILSRYEADGGVESSWGGPIGASQPSGIGHTQPFQAGEVYASPLGVFMTRGSIRSVYVSQNGPSGVLGAPITDEIKPMQGIAYQEFSGGNIYWTKRWGTFSVLGAMRDAYTSTSGLAETLGFPIAAQTALSGGKTRQVFEHGSITLVPGQDPQIDLAR